MLQYIRICTRGGFMGIEYGILDFIAENIRCAFLDPIMAALSIFGNYGMGWIILALPLLIPRKTRTAAATALVAMLIGALAGEFALKHIVCRPRPYLTYEQFHGFAMPFTFNTGPHDQQARRCYHNNCRGAGSIFQALQLRALSVRRSRGNGNRNSLCSACNLCFQKILG